MNRSQLTGRMYLIQTPIFIWGYPCPLLEQSCKMLWILKTQIIGDFAYRFVNIKNLLLSNINNFGLNLFLCHFACFFLLHTYLNVNKKHPLRGSFQKINTS